MECGLCSDLFTALNPEYQLGDHLESLVLFTQICGHTAVSLICTGLMFAKWLLICKEF